jgi:hypothetical protein
MTLAAAEAGEAAVAAEAVDSHSFVPKLQLPSHPSRSEAPVPFLVPKLQLGNALSGKLRLPVG